MQTIWSIYFVSFTRNQTTTRHSSYAQLHSCVFDLFWQFYQKTKQTKQLYVYMWKKKRKLWLWTCQATESEKALKKTYKGAQMWIWKPNETTWWRQLFWTYFEKEETGIEQGNKYMPRILKVCSFKFYYRDFINDYYTSVGKKQRILIIY